MRFCVLVWAWTGQTQPQSHRWRRYRKRKKRTETSFFTLAESAFYSFIHSFLSRVLSVNTSFIMRRRQRKCWFRENIKKSAAGGKQSEEREEEMLRGYESDRGRKTKECQEGWGGGPVWPFLSFAVLHVHLEPLTGGSEIREKENRRFIRLQMRSGPCTTEGSGQKSCVLPGSPSITKITLPPPSDRCWIPMLKSTLITHFSNLIISEKEKNTFWAWGQAGWSFGNFSRSCFLLRVNIFHPRVNTEKINCPFECKWTSITPVQEWTQRWGADSQSLKLPVF